MIGTRLDRYRITAALGAGGMGEVWQATDTKLGREVALKVLPTEFAEDPERLARFEREAKVLASLNHPNIAHLYGLETATPSSASASAPAPASDRSGADGDAGPVTFLVMELVDGEGLDEVIARGPVPVEDATRIALQIAEALEAAHEAGIVHRDLKPANVRIRPDGTVKVLDFGLAKAWEDGEATDLSLSPTLTRHATAAGVILGTAAYMAPEQARGKPVDRRADIWSFGVVVWEMLTGRQLFDGDTVTDVLAAVLTREPELDALPDGTPPALRRLVARCLIRDPRSRLQWIGEARIALSDPAAPDPAPLAPPSERSSRWPWVAAAIAIPIALAAGWFLNGPTRESIASRVAAVVLAPPGTEFAFDGDQGRSLSLSPDGRWMTFSATTGGGPPSLWLRPLGDTAARPLPGTEDATFPFWSPDSREIAFFSDGFLRRLALDAPAPVEICRAANGRSGGWNEDGVIVFSPDPGSPIHRVSAAGGEPEPVTELDAELRETTHRWARFLPDGRHFLFTAGGHDEPATSPTNAIWVADLETGARSRLVEARSNAAYASGYLLFGSSGALLARPFDVDRRRVTGSPMVVVPKVVGMSEYFASDFDVSGSGVLTYREGDAGGLLQLRRVDTETLEIGETVGDPAAITEIALSPDGNRAALVIFDAESGTSDIWVHDIDRDVRSRLTFGKHVRMGSMAWSPDGTRITFWTATSGGGSEIRIVDLDRAQEPDVLLTSDDQQLGPSAWMHGGRTLLYNRGGDLWTLDLETGVSRVFLESPTDVFGAAVSPDEQWVLYTSIESGRTTTFVCAFEDSARRWQITDIPVIAMEWRGNREIWIVAQGPSFYRVSFEVRDGAPLIGRLEPAGEMPNTRNGDMAPDGSHLLVAFGLEQLDDIPIHLMAGWTSRLEGE